MTVESIEPPPLPAPDPSKNGPSAGGAETVDEIVRGSLPDRANPVFVKEVRQAQRGKVFSITLIITIVLAMFGASMVSIEILDGDSSQPGVDFFSGVYFLLAVAVLVVVPFQAFVSMGSEWDGDTFEMLLLSNLRPLQIVSGKVLASALQGLMFGLAFLPFLVTAFLLRGVDFGVLLLVLGLTALASVCLSVMAVMLSTLVRTGFIRVVFMVALAGALFSLVPAATTIARFLLSSPEVFVGPEFGQALFYLVLTALLATGLAGCIACNTLAHEEENRSTNVRIVLTAMVLALIGILTHGVFRSSASPVRQDGVFGAAIMGCFVLSFFCMFLCLERDRLGIRVAHRVPRSRWLAFLLAPWLPGGGRGFVFLWLHLGLLVVCALGIGARAAVSPWATGGAGTQFERWTITLFGAAVYALLYAMAPSVLFGSRPGAKIAQRNAARVGGMMLPIALLIGPAIAGILLGIEDWQRMRHFGNPIHFFDGAMRSGIDSSGAGFGFVLVVVLVLGLFAAQRAAEGIGEVVRGKPRVRRASSESAS